MITSCVHTSLGLTQQTGPLYAAYNMDCMTSAHSTGSAWGHLNQHRLSIGQFTVVCTDVHTHTHTTNAECKRHTHTHTHTRVHAHEVCNPIPHVTHVATHTQQMQISNATPATIPTHTRTHTRTHTHTHTHTHARTHTHTHTHTQVSKQPVQPPRGVRIVPSALKERQYKHTLSC